MTPAQALYLLDCYKREFEAKVISIKDNKFVILDKTAFYPNAGGQPYDTGKLVRKSDNKEFPVIYVAKFNDQISHEIQNGEDLKEGDEVTGKIDWQRRYKHMCFHTAAHIIAKVFYEDTKAVTTGNQIAEDRSRIDFKLETFDRDKILSLEPKINSIIARALPVKFSILPRDEAENSLERFNYLKVGFTPDVKDIRIVEIVGYDRQACGGTHVANTKEIGKIKITKLENKGKDNRRMYFELEE